MLQLWTHFHYTFLFCLYQTVNKLVQRCWHIWINHMYYHILNREMLLLLYIKFLILQFFYIIILNYMNYLQSLPSFSLLPLNCDLKGNCQCYCCNLCYSLTVICCYSCNLCNQVSVLFRIYPILVFFSLLWSDPLHCSTWQPILFFQFFSHPYFINLPNYV